MKPCGQLEIKEFVLNDCQYKNTLSLFLFLVNLFYRKCYRFSSESDYMLPKSKKPVGIDLPQHLDKLADEKRFLVSHTKTSRPDSEFFQLFIVGNLIPTPLNLLL